PPPTSPGRPGFRVLDRHRDILAPRLRPDRLRRALLRQRRPPTVPAPVLDLFLRQYPIVSVQSVRYRPVTVLKFINNDVATNQQAPRRLRGALRCALKSRRAKKKDQWTSEPIDL